MFQGAPCRVAMKEPLCMPRNLFCRRQHFLPSGRRHCEPDGILTRNSHESTIAVPLLALRQMQRPALHRVTCGSLSLEKVGSSIGSNQDGVGNMTDKKVKPEHCSSLWWLGNGQIKVCRLTGSAVRMYINSCLVVTTLSFSRTPGRYHPEF
jgi:hypothetical protein